MTCPLLPSGEDLEDLEVYGIDTKTGPQLHTFKFEVALGLACVVLTSCLF